jgi:peptide/nickel transport system ATP-binding protein
VITTVPLLDVCNLSVAIRGRRGDVQALTDVSLSVDRQEVVGIVGESGGGKSMLARAIVRLLPDAAEATGRVQLGGVDVMRLTGEALRLHRGGGAALCFQAPRTALDPLRSIGDQVTDRIVAHHGVARRAARDQALALLRQVGIVHIERRMAAYPHEFSGGMCQRVMIAMALACRASLLIADEPTTGLDVTLTRDILRLIADQARNEEGRAVIIISHDIASLAEVCDRLVVIELGRVVEEGPTARVIGTPRHAYTRRLIAAVPDVMRRGQGSAAAERAPMLRLDAVGYAYPVRFRRAARPVLFEVSLAADEGETVGVVGESGSGKSTLARLIMGLLRPTTGRVLIEGTDVATLRGARMQAFRRNMQMVFQDPYDALNPRRTVEQTVTDPLRLLPLSRAERDRRIDTILVEVGLDPSYRRRLPHELSGGQAQRVGIARALVIDPHLVVLDEPTSALDVTIQAQILDLIRGLIARRDRTYFFVSHDLAIVRDLCDRLIVLSQGRIVEDGPTERVFTSPRHAYTRTLLAAAPRLPVSPVQLVSSHEQQRLP